MRAVLLVFPNLPMMLFSINLKSNVAYAKKCIETDLWSIEQRCDVNDFQLNPIQKESEEYISLENPSSITELLTHLLSKRLKFQ